MRNFAIRYERVRPSWLTGHMVKHWDTAHIWFRSRRSRDNALKEWNKPEEFYRNPCAVNPLRGRK